MTTMGLAATPSRALLCNDYQSPPKLPLSRTYYLPHHFHVRLQLPPKFMPIRRQHIIPCSASRRWSINSIKNSELVSEEEDEDEIFRRRLSRAVLWVMEGVYIFWLFLLPYAPGDPVWAISSDTINSLVGLSLNFFFILPLANSVQLFSAEDKRPKSTSFYTHMYKGFLNHRVVGIHAMEAPVLHPMSEGLFNFVVGWTAMFSPLLYTDFKNGRYKGSLDVLWGLQMFLTNAFLIPYMAIRLNEADASNYPKKLSRLGTGIVKGAPVVGLTCGIVCALSIIWALFGRMDGNFGSVSDRWNFFFNYLGSERLAYAFIWDIVLYMIFQPWLIGENLANVADNKVVLVNYIRYIPVVGLLAYCLCLKTEEVVEKLE